MNKKFNCTKVETDTLPIPEKIKGLADLAKPLI